MISELRAGCVQKTCGGLHVESLLLLPDFNKNWYVTTDSSKFLQYPIWWE